MSATRWLCVVAFSACSSSSSPPSTGSAMAAHGSGSATISVPVPPKSGTRPSLAGAPLIRHPTATVRCGKLATVLDAPSPLLADRLRIKVPRRAQASPRPWDLMDAPQAAEQETRVMVGDSRMGTGSSEAMAIVARETWQLDPDVAKADAGAIVQPTTFAAEAPKFLAAVYGDVDIEAVRLDDAEIHAFAARPKKIDAGDADSALVLALLLSLPDATLVTLQFNISPALVPRGSQCTDLAERIAATLARGPRQLERTAGVRVVQDLKPTQRLSMTVPEDYVLVHQPGQDFDRHTLYLLRPLGLFPGEIEIVVDAHIDGSVPPDATDSAPGSLLGHAVTWRGKREQGGGYLATTVPISGDRRMLQVVLRATREAKYLDDFAKVASTLALISH